MEPSRAWGLKNLWAMACRSCAKIAERNLLDNISKHSPYPRLCDLMGGYLHQDFDFSYESDDAAIQDYVATHREKEVRETVAEIDRLLAEPSLGLLEHFKEKISRWDFIIGETDEEAHAWLLKARNLMAAV